MNSPMVSVLMPCYNGGKYIRAAMQSIMDQSLSDWELIIVNDASTDDSRSIIESFADERIRCISHTKNLGVVASRNRALKESNGRYLAIMDADDVARPDKLSRQVDFLEKNHRFGLVGSWAKIIDKKGADTGRSWKLRAGPDKIKAELIFRNYFIHSAILVRKEAALRFPYETGLEIGEDYKFVWDISRHWDVANLQEHLVSYRIHSSNITHKLGLHRNCLLDMYQRIFSEIGLEATPEQLGLHINLRGNLKLVRDYPPTKYAEWLKRIRTLNADGNLAKPASLDRVIFSRWAKVCAAHWRNPAAVIRESLNMMSHD